MKPTVSPTNEKTIIIKKHMEMSFFLSVQLILILFRFKVFTISQITKMLLLLRLVVMVVVLLAVIEDDVTAVAAAATSAD